ncbi:MAG TPA: META domain-containing protein [Sphingomicrobium sp.]
MDARTFDGTRWHVLAVNQHITPNKGDYRIEFQDGRISARFGCNSIGGSYSATGGRLTTHQLISTKMACGAPADEFEKAGAGILNAPLRIRESGKGRLRLSNRIGSLDLETLR